MTDKSTSLRQVITEAGVNLAAVHYHFGSKEDLLDEVVERRAGPVNKARLALLDPPPVVRVIGRAGSSASPPSVRPSCR